MATIINNPPQQTPASNNDDGSGMGMVLGIVALIVVLFLIFIGWPTLRGRMSQDGVVPSQTSDGINVQVPDKINVNINKGN